MTNEYQANNELAWKFYTISLLELCPITAIAIDYKEHKAPSIQRSHDYLYLAMLPVSIGLSGSCSQGSYFLSLDALQIKIFIFASSRVIYPLTTLETANVHIILVPHMMIK